MAPRITLIDDIKAGKVDYRIKVRVVHIWNVPEYNKPNVTKSMEMILVDEKCGKIQASVKQNLLEMFANTLQEGSCYLIQNLLVAANIDTKFRASRHKYKLTFIRTTMCMKSDDSSIPICVLNFVNFAIISSGLDETHLIDVIGHVVQRSALRENEKNGVKSLLIDLVLEDLEGNKIDCTLWGDYATAFNSYIENKDFDGSVIVILHGCKMRIFNSKVGISNSFDATKLWLNPDFKECIEYKNRLENTSGSGSQIVSYISSQSFISVTDDFLQCPRLTISDVIDLDKELQCVVYAKIIDFDTSVGWYYYACTKCAKKVTQRVGNLYYCSKCANMVLASPRCKVHVQVIDETGSTYFILFDRLATQVLGDAVAPLFVDVEKGTYDGKWPSAFDVLLNKDMLFKILATQNSIYNSWRTYTVKRISDSSDLIKDFKKQHGIQDQLDADVDVQTIISPEVGDNIKGHIVNDGITSLDNGNNFDKENTVNIGDNTPNFNKTKEKRINIDEEFGSPVEGTCSQNSSTKFPKVKKIKTEPTE